MGLIRSENAPVGLPAFSMKDVEHAAKTVLLRAQAKAEQILAQARQEGEALKQQAHAEGLASGNAQGLAQGREEGKKAGHAEALAANAAAMKKLIETLNLLTQDLEDKREELLSSGVREVVDLACSIARRVTRRQGIVDSQVLGENLKDAMALAVHAADIRLAVNPAQVQTLRAELPNLKLKWPQLKHVDVVEEASISPGGARIYTLHGQVDADLETQLDRIERELLPAPLTIHAQPAVSQ